MMNRLRASACLHVFLLLSTTATITPTLRAADAPPPDLQGLVRGYADAMIEHSRTQLPEPRLPLFPIVLTRDTYQIPAGKVSNLYTARVPQEFKNIANIHHDLNLYQVFYALSQITGEKKYAAEADRIIDWFLHHCQEPKYGFFGWGEHIGWDLTKNQLGGQPTSGPYQDVIHEFYRPWIYWQKSFDMAPEQSLRFAQALWRHQIDHKDGKISFSRHAMISSPTPSRRGKDFPRHGGFYIATWAAAYQHTKDPEMLEAMDALVAFYEKSRDPTTGAIPHGSDDFAFDKEGHKVAYMYSQSPVSLAVDLETSAAVVPEALKQRMLALAKSIETSFLAMKHEPGPGGKGFILFADLKTLAATEYWQSKEEVDLGLPPRRIPYTGGWRSAYTGQHPHTWVVPAIIARYEQTQNEGYKKLLLSCADNYLTSDPEAALNEKPVNKGDRPSDIEAGSIGNAIVLLNAAYKMTHDDKYLARAEWFAAWGAKKYWPDANPLPRASVRENIYSAASRCDTLAMAMLQTSLLRNQPEKEKEVSLIATDR